MRDLRMGVVGVIVLGLATVCLAEWPYTDFYTDGVIQDGNTFSVVRTFDNATVNMTGGLIDGGLYLYDNSIFNAYGGTVNSTEVVVLENATLNLYYLQLSENHRINTSGDSARINVYGENFEYVQSSGDWLLFGNWANNEEFILRLRGPDTRNYVFTHEIPEPGTFVLLIFGALGLAKKNR